MQSRSNGTLTLFGSSHSFQNINASYQAKLSHVRQLIDQLSEKEKAQSATKLATNGAYQFNSHTHEWELITELTSEKRKKSEFEAANELAALFSQQNESEENDPNPTVVTQSFKQQAQAILVKHGLQNTPNPQLDTVNKDLVEALRQLAQKLEMPADITSSEAQVAIEVMDVVSTALNVHLGTDKATDPKELILKMSKLANELENKSSFSTISIILATLLLITCFVMIGIGIACLMVPGFHLAIATLIGLSAELFTSGFLPGTLLGLFAPLSCFAIFSVGLGWGYKSLNSNPELSKAISDVAKPLELDFAQISTPTMTG